MLAYRIDPARRLVLLHGTGALTSDEVLGIQSRWRADPAFDPAFRLLADYRDVTRSDFNRENMLRIAANVPFHPSSRRAFVARGRLGFGLARMFEGVSSYTPQGGTVRVFRDLAEAEAWLG
jgi:hypothetical protein